MKQLNFTKMHGLGNDFILFDDRKGTVPDYHNLAGKICRRRFSIGADGIILIQNSDTADLKMRIFNSDGSEAEMCGNGIRCFAGYVYKRNIINKRKLSVETGAGIIKPEILNGDGEDLFVRVDMGHPILERKLIPLTGDDTPTVIDEKLTAKDREFTFSAVSMGNPHCIIFTDKVTKELVRGFGPIIEKLPLFPAATNVEFVEVIDRGRVKVGVWERGAGETLACGTGACAVAVAGINKKILDSKVEVMLPGGSLLIEWDGKGSVFMTGPAHESFEGVITV